MKKPPYIFHVDNLYFFPKWVTGAAIYPFIFIKNDNEQDAEEYITLIEHEKIHIQQQLKGWIIGFYIMYLYYNIRYGYKKNPYEIEAYAHQNDWRNS